MKEGYKPTVICTPVKNWVPHDIPNHNISLIGHMYFVLYFFLLIENMSRRVLKERSILKTVPMYNMIDMGQYNVYATNYYFQKSKFHF